MKYLQLLIGMMFLAGPVNSFAIDCRSLFQSLSVKSAAPRNFDMQITNWIEASSIDPKVKIELLDVLVDEGFRSSPLDFSRPTLNSQNGLGFPQMVQLLSGKIPNESRSPINILDLALNTVYGLPKFTPMKRTITRIGLKMREIIFGSTQENYAAGGFALTKGNEGIIAYTTRGLVENPSRLLDATLFYLKLKEKEDTSFGAGASTLFEKAEFDVWKLALRTFDGDAKRALDALLVFGHDDVSQELFYVDNPTSNRYLNILNKLRPGRDSNLYKTASNPFLVIPDSFLERFESFENRAQDLNFEDPSLDPIESFRAGYYHFYAGALISRELVLDGHRKIAGLKLPVIIAESSGYYYKRFTMETFYFSRDAKTLYQKGYPKKQVEIPIGWGERRFEQAKLNIEMNLAFLELTRDQHRRGAEWAYQIYTR